MPASNVERRRLVADTAIALLAREGARGLTHRAIEREADLPTGTASNYLPTRDALFHAAARRIGELHIAAMDDVARRTSSGSSMPTRARAPRSERAVTALLTDSLLTAATRDRDRYLALFELQAESLRRPSLVEPLQELQGTVMAFTREHHRQLGLEVPRTRVAVLMELYGAVLHSLVLRPPGSVERATVSPLAQAVVRGTLG